MGAADLRYLLRYVFILLTVYAAGSLLRRAWQEFRWGMKHAMRPAQGYYLLTNPRRRLRRVQRPPSKRQSADAAGGDGDLGEAAEAKGFGSRFGRRMARPGRAHRLKDLVLQALVRLQRWLSPQPPVDLWPMAVTVGAPVQISYRGQAQLADAQPGHTSKGSVRLAFWGRKSGNQASDEAATWGAGQAASSGSAGYQDFSATTDNAPVYYNPQGQRAPDSAEALLGDSGEVMALPLYPTTLMGRAKSADIRMKTDAVERRHCTIYRFDGDWYIQPNNPRNLVLINGEAIQDSTKLENRDRLQLGDLIFIFVDERTETEAMGLEYHEAKQDDAYFYEAVELTSKQPTLAWFVFNLFTLLGGAIIVFGLPEAFTVYREYIAASFLIYLGLVDLYYLLLPKFLGYADRLSILAVGFLSSFGLILQARLCFFDNPYFVEQLGTGDPSLIQEAQELMFNRYIQFAASSILSLALFWLLAILVAKTRLMENLVGLCFIATPLLLLASKLLGTETYGASLRIQIGPVALQPTEFVKISYLVVLASFFKNRPPLRQQIFFAVWAAVNFLLILSLPDLGSLMILVPVTLIVFATMTSDFLKTGLLVVAIVIVGGVGLAIFPHAQQRIMGWTSLFSEVNDANYQIVYGLQAVARGGLTGRGIGNGNPWGIPLFNSDMIYTILCEEFGLLVGLAVVVFYMVIWLRSARTCALARDGFSAALALGLGSAIFVEALVVICGTMGLIPLTGATLPWVALGSNSLIAKWLMFAILQGLSARSEERANR